MEIFELEFMRRAAVASFCIALLCPCIGIFLVLRRNSLMGDTLSHASLAGVALALCVPVNPLIGALTFTSICGLIIEFLRNYFKNYSDLILAIVMALSAGTAVTVISSGSLGTDAGAYILGSVLTVSRADTIMIGGLTLLCLLLSIILWDQLLYVVYDEEAAKIAGVKVKLISYGFSLLSACAAAVSIQIVGVLVLSSLTAIPVAAALLLHRNFRETWIFSIIFSLTAMSAGFYASYWLDAAPGGLTALFAAALLFGVLLFRKLKRPSPLPESGQPAVSAIRIRYMAGFLSVLKKGRGREKRAPGKQDTLEISCKTVSSGESDTTGTTCTTRTSRTNGKKCASPISEASGAPAAGSGIPEKPGDMTKSEPSSRGVRNV